jgi:hypothetical protein
MPQVGKGPATGSVCFGSNFLRSTGGIPRLLQRPSRASSARGSHASAARRRTQPRSRCTGSLRLAAALSGPVRNPGRRLTTNSPPTGFRGANRTAPLDRAYSDPGSRNSDRTRGGPIRFNDLRASRPNSFRTLRRIGRAAPHRVTTSRMRSCDSRLRPNVSTRGFNAIAPQRPYTCTVTSHARPMPFHRKPANTLRAQRGPSTISHEDIRETVCIMVNQVR